MKFKKLIIGILVIVVVFVTVWIAFSPTIDNDFRKICLEIQRRLDTVDINNEKEWNEYVAWKQAAISSKFWKRMRDGTQANYTETRTLKEQCHEVGVKLKEEP